MAFLQATALPITDPLGGCCPFRGQTVCLAHPELHPPTHRGPNYRAILYVRSGTLQIAMVVQPPPQTGIDGDRSGIVPGACGFIPPIHSGSVRWRYSVSWPDSPEEVTAFVLYEILHLSDARQPRV